MTDYKLLERLSSIRDMLLGDQRRKVEELIADIKFDMESDKLPKDSVTVAKAAAKFAKDCYKEFKDYRKGIAGANYYHDHRDMEPDSLRQYICTNNLGVSYSKPFEGLVEADRENPLNFDVLLTRTYNEGYAEIKLLSRAELKKAIKMERSTKGKRYIVRLKDGKCFDIDLLVQAMELSGCTGGEVIQSVKHVYYPAFIYNQLADGNEVSCIVMPIRMKPELEDKILWDEMESA